MKFCFAPLEGITYPEYRQLHAELFGGAAEYHAPFIAPSSGGFKQSFLEKKLPDRACGYKLVPQLLVNSADAFLETAHQLADLGFREVNLNVGCPSGTVFAKHKGSGMLSDLNSFEELLDRIFAGSELKISLKTRMGIVSTEEFGRILELYNRYPITELIVHARAREGYYKSEPDREGFLKAFRQAKMPVCYNGNIFSPEDLSELKELLPELDSVMVGRGAVANPALIRMLNGGACLSLEEFQAFHDRLEALYAAEYDDSVVLHRMKELWYYMISLFDDSARQEKRILKARSVTDYHGEVERLLAECPFHGDAVFRNIQ